MSQIITIATVVFMCALLIVGLYFLYKKTRLKMIQRIQYSREFNKVGVYEGQRVTFTEIIYNDSWFPLFFIDMESWIDQELRLQNQPFNPNKSKQLVISRFHLWPHMEIRREHSMVCITPTSRKSFLILLPKFTCIRNVSNLRMCRGRSITFRASRFPTDN